MLILVCLIGLDHGLIKPDKQIIIIKKTNNKFTVSIKFELFKVCKQSKRKVNQLHIYKCLDFYRFVM